MKPVHTTQANPQRPRHGRSGWVWSVAMAATVAAAFALAPMPRGPNLEARAGTGELVQDGAVEAASIDPGAGETLAPIEPIDAGQRQSSEDRDAVGRSVAAYDR